MRVSGEVRIFAIRQASRFVIALEGITKDDRDDLQEFFDDAKGGFDATWDITVGGVTYSYMVFDSDSFECQEVEAEHWNVTLACSQARKN